MLPKSLCSSWPPDFCLKPGSFNQVFRCYNAKYSRFYTLLFRVENNLKMKQQSYVSVFNVKSHKFMGLKSECDEETKQTENSK